MTSMDQTKQLQSYTDEELDRIAAVEVMGWEYETVQGDETYRTHGDKLWIHTHEWHPTTDLNDAWRLVEKVCKDRRWRLDYLRWAPHDTGEEDFEAQFMRDDWGEDNDNAFYSDPYSPALALTIAAIKATRSIKGSET